MTSQASPSLFCRLGEFEHHGQARASGSASLRAFVSQANRGKRRFYWVRGPQRVFQNVRSCFCEASGHEVDHGNAQHCFAVHQLWGGSPTNRGELQMC